ncbi:hypothetical protein [Sphingomonas mesophila]|uniref:hypothetical protein n=1 Tax=Sphingomonas mesophila TaxID=2303576 RepID=UPI0013C344CD|nr:hypothetical protein [Sphingomonas mesophila]
MRTLVAGLIIVGLAAPAAAQKMNAEEFHRRADALHKKGSRALLSMGEIRALTKEVRAAGELIKARRIAAEKAGEKPRYCPPKGASRRMGTDEFMARLSAIPRPERQAIDMAEALNRILATKHPC